MKSFPCINTCIFPSSKPTIPIFFFYHFNPFCYFKMKYIHTVVALIIALSSMTIAADISPRRYNLINRLEAQNIDVDTIGCKCIMTSPSKENSDSTLCLCFNRPDGSTNDTSKCRAYTGNVLLDEAFDIIFY